MLSGVQKDTKRIDPTEYRKNGQQAALYYL